MRKGCEKNKRLKINCEHTYIYIYMYICVYVYVYVYVLYESYMNICTINHNNMSIVSDFSKISNGFLSHLECSRHVSAKLPSPVISLPQWSSLRHLDTIDNKKYPYLIKLVGS